MMDDDDIEQLKPVELRSPSVLYHYTTPTAFQNIVEKQELWASDWRFLNDKSELKLGVEIFDQELKRKKDLFPSTMMDAIYQARNDILDDRKFQGIDYCLFVASFCSSTDLLSQWRSYGRGRGVSIGFHRSYLKGVGRTNGFGLTKVRYSEEDQLGLLNMMLQSVSMMTAGGSQNATNSQTNDFWFTIIPTLLGMKHHSFKEEHEWRLVGFLPTIRQNIRFRSTESSIIPYYPLNLVRSDRMKLDSKQPHAFQSVMLGPGWHAESKLSVQMLLRANKVEAPVDITKTPFVP